MDLSDNEIKKLDNFPRMNRLTMLLMSNNNVSKIAASIGSTQLVNLKALILVELDFIIHFQYSSYINILTMI
jgi:U2 small nuclear ribonucleoprotein A'